MKIFYTESANIEKGRLPGGEKPGAQLSIIPFIRVIPFILAYPARKPVLQPTEDPLRQPIEKTI